jgi:hypothetical protein
MNEDPEMMKVFSNSHLWHAVLDFYLAHDAGGVGEPLDKLKYS